MTEITCGLRQGGPVPLYEQLYRHIAGEIQAGRLAAGARLPSKRALGAHLRVSVCTVETAYGMLLDEGYIRTEARRGYYVCRLTPLPAVPAGGPPPRKAAAKPGPPPAEKYDFSTSSTDASIFPYKTWVKLFRETLYARPELLLRGDAQGDDELREALSLFLYEYRGVRCPADRLVVGAGVDYLLSILLSLFPRGTAVAAEDPGYQGIYRVGERQGVRVLPVPDDGGGMDVAALERSGAGAAYVTPSHQFPLGTSMPIGRRTRLLSWAAEAPGRWVIEDDYDSEFRYSARTLPAMQGLGDGSRTVYIGTFSRSLAPSMRVAYMALPPDLALGYAKTFIKCGDTVSRFEQQTLAAFIGGGYYGRHLRRARNVYESRCKALCGSLCRIPGTSVRGQEAGLHFLLTVPSLGEEQLVGKAAGRGIRLRGLSEFCREAEPLDSTLVIGYAGLKDSLVAEAAGELRAAWGL